MGRQPSIIIIVHVKQNIFHDEFNGKIFIEISSVFEVVDILNSSRSWLTCPNTKLSWTLFRSPTDNADASPFFSSRLKTTGSKKKHAPSPHNQEELKRDRWRVEFGRHAHLDRCLIPQITKVILSMSGWQKSVRKTYVGYVREKETLLHNLY